MALARGTRLGPYEIVDPLGSGGMGEVYRARDPRLGRDVAVKGLAERSWLDPDSVSRFTREAQTLAALNHPHIAGIYGLEELPSSSGPHSDQYLILELVEGGTLLERIARGPLPLREALAIGRQVADALHAAHDKGILHRDLKPGNIALTRGGDAKVLDFGLAKAIEQGAGPGAEVTAATKTGVVLGTAAYMSPEQARGLPVDRRSDIWAFGCVLYEMLTARHPFRGETISDTIAAVLGREPDWSILPTGTPARVIWLLKRCLEKDPRRRLHDIADARIELDEILANPTDGAPAASGSARGRAREWAAWAIAALSLATATVLVLNARRPPAAVVAAPAYRSALVLPDNLHPWLQEGSSSASFAVSPDGTRLAIVASDANGTRLLWIRALDGSRALPLAGTEDAQYPFWSADSRSVGYLRPPPGRGVGIQRELMRVDADGGQPVKMADASIFTWASWNKDDTILFTPAGNAPIHRVSATGGGIAPVTTLDSASGEVQHAYPWFLPDGRRFLYTVIGGKAGATVTRGVYLGSLDKGEPPRLLVAGAFSARYGSGYLAFIRETSLFVQPFNPDTLQLSGEPLPFPEHIELVPGAGGGAGGAFSLSQTGVLVFQPAANVRSRLEWFDRSGHPLGTVGDPANYAEVALSPDGTRAAVSALDPQVGTRDLWVFDVARGTRERLTDDPSEDFAPVWSPDGKRIAFSSQRTGGVDLYVEPADGLKNEAPLPVPGLTVGKFAAQWSADGKYLLFVAGGRIIARSDVWALPLASGEKPFAVSDKPTVETQPRLSSDGRWLALSTSDTGTLEVYVTAFPGPGDRRRVSTHGGQLPRWSRDGTEIFFVGPDSTLMVAPVSYDHGEPRIGETRPLFRMKLRPVVRLDAYPYDVSADGRRFLLNTPIEDQPRAPLALVVNWPATIRR
jgi:Tol biopolymer transport system component